MIGTEWEGLISEEQEKRLIDMGIEDKQELAIASLSRLVTSGFTRAEAIDLVTRAQSSMAFNFLRGPQIIKRGTDRWMVSTNSSSVDSLLGGGVKTGLVTDFFGESGVGKTQIAFQLCANINMKKDRRTDTLFVDTVGTFRPERIAQMAEANGLKKDMVLERILVSELRTLEDQLDLPRDIEEISSNHKISLLIIDTLTENFLQTYGGEEGGIRRQSLLGKHLHDLGILALQYNIMIIVTNTVRSRVNDTNEIIEIGGNVVSQGIPKRIRLINTGGRRVARLVDHPLGNRDVFFKIGESGITD
jgi:DNA repair protein RadA